MSSCLKVGKRWLCRRFRLVRDEWNSIAGSEDGNKWRQLFSGANTAVRVRTRRQLRQTLIEPTRAAPTAVASCNAQFAAIQTPNFAAHSLVSSSRAALSHTRERRLSGHRRAAAFVKRSRDRARARRR